MNRHLRPSCIALVGLLLAFLAAPARAQVQQDLSVQIYSISSTAVNFQRGVNYTSQRGAPGKPGVAGNDGRLTGQITTASSGQFRGVVTYGAVIVPTKGATLLTGKNYEENAIPLNLPHTTIGQPGINARVGLVLRSAQLAAPTFGRISSFNFGAVISPPITTEGGDLLPQPNNYWVAEPYSASGHTNVGDTTVPAGYYWSPHAKRVFATQPGPIQVAWRHTEPAPAGVTLPGDKVTLGGLDYAVTNVAYVVSGSAVKTPRKLYWTEKSFNATGKPVVVPTARVSVVYFHYNSAFPRTVGDEFLPLGSSSFTDGSTNAALKELRTAWYDSTQELILAYNKEGRVFLELLGDVVGEGARQHLGFEVIDVIQQGVPQDLQADLGEKITAYPDITKSDLDLNPEPVQIGITSDFLYRDQSGSQGRGDYYAIKETQNRNDVLVHWLEAGQAGLRWPLFFNRYQLIWPDDPARYSHYLRPPVATQDEAVNTAVTLSGNNAPFLQYQDPMDKPRAFLNEKFQFYTFLDAAHPVHRTLLRINSGERVAFERVLSLLNTQVYRETSSAFTDWSGVVPRPGRLSALNLSGVGYGQLPPGVYFDGGSYTIESWVNVTEHRNLARLLDFGNGSPQPAQAVDVVLNNFNTQRPAGYTQINGGVNTGVAATSVLPTNQWVHLAVVFDKTNRTLSIYFNGAREASVANAVGPLNVTRNYNFVGGSLFGELNARTSFDNIRIWTTARSASEITSGMNTNAYPAGTPGLEVQFTFDEGGTIAYDSSGKNHHMFLFGGATLSNTSLLGNGAPRFVSYTVNVGDRITPPFGEIGNLAGYILQSSGRSYHSTAYIDPFANGFDAANLGSIIPVNAIPGTNTLEVWWFRKNATNSIKNPANGFLPIYWPAVIGRYKLEFNENTTNLIVMAGNAGSGPLSSLQAKGTVYTQNDPTLPGYNPNEEHGVAIGGQVYALRDDLNLVGTTVPAVLPGAGATFSSKPYVLLDYKDSDGRTSVRAFKVLRDLPAYGIVFDYVVEAGKQLQPPMPLPFLPPPVEILTNNATNPKSLYETNYNKEVPSLGVDLPAGWYSPNAPTNTFSHYAKFTWLDRKESIWVMRGPHTGLPRLEAGFYDTTTPSRPFFQTNVTAGGPLYTFFLTYIHTSRPTNSLMATVSPSTPLPFGLAFGPVNGGLAVYGFLFVNTGTYNLIITDADGSQATVNFTLNSTPKVTPALFLNNLYGRPPQLAATPAATNSFTMRFYYATQEGFAWPGVASPPAVGTVVPYLRARTTTGFGGLGRSSSDAALDIVYRPVWPANAPTIAFGETLMGADKGRPAIRGQTSARVLYQQSIATNFLFGNDQAAVTLHDPTVFKTFALKTNDTELSKLPGGVRSENYQGKTYFPNLPPHLAERFFFDPNTGAKGSLIFKGEFKDELFGEKYLLLNVLRGSDLDTVKALCPANPVADKTKWDKAVDAMAATVTTFITDPKVPGQFIASTNTQSVAITNLVAITNDNTAVDSYALSAAGPGQGFVTLIVGNGGAFTPEGEPVSMYVLRVTGSLFRGEIKILESANPLNELITFEHTADLAGKNAEYEYEWKIGPPVDGFPPVVDATMSRYQALTNGTDIKRYTLGGSGIRTLVDNWLVMRYRPKNTLHPLFNGWSEWTRPQLAEGWIKRVLGKINPFNQRVTDLYNNAVSTDVSVLTQAGHRYEGDIALNMKNINSYGLIEIYETVLNRGKNLSINAGVPVNFGPANDALLLAAGYINDLYMLVGNEAYADAANPTIGIGTKDRDYGSIATALFAFKGQVPSLLEEELALLRGRDDVALPGVEIKPVYNRLVWNYTRGIDAGEVIYALNYNILDQNADGKADATDAVTLYPQGHGDAYGHYLTALKGYYSLITNPNFDWVPRIEAVTILGQPVSVDYLDERKFAAAAAAVARTGRQVFDLSWRKDYTPGRTSGWESFATNRISSRVVTNGIVATNVVRHWGMDQWASRTGQGTLVNWVIGNSILPEVDPDPSHEGIQKVDRTTVPELNELTATATDLQADMDAAEGRLTPLGVTEGSIAFDLNPAQITGSDPKTHFEQIYDRTRIALNNALAAFDDTKDVTRLMRSEEDSLADLRATVASQELAFTNSLIELFGTPYPDDTGPGKTYDQGYEGPDLYHYMYVETPEINFGPWLNPTTNMVFHIDVQDYPSSWLMGNQDRADAFDFLHFGTEEGREQQRTETNDFIVYNLEPHGYFQKPSTWTGKRRSPGELQQAISEVIKARSALLQALDDSKGAKEDLDGAIRIFKAGVEKTAKITRLEEDLATAEQVTAAVERANDIFQAAQDQIKDGIELIAEGISAALPTDLIAGLAAGGDLTSGARGALKTAGASASQLVDTLAIARLAVVAALRTATDAAATGVQFQQINPLEQTQERREALHELEASMNELQGLAYGINRALQDYDDAQRKVAALIARGDRLLQERQITRQRTAAVIQGFRTRDVAFRIFRNEKLERYKTLFDLASRYAFLAANAYDYDTGLLGTDKGRAFVNRIVSSRALGVVKDGEPQFAGSNTGDPGLSSALAEMKADFDVLKGRLGFNSPDGYSTLASVRTGNKRILGDASGLSAWQDYLQQSKMDNILEDSDVRRYCQQVDPGTGLAVPGIVITFSTSINPGESLFGRALAEGDSAFHRSSFATKIHSVGVAFEGYKGMNYPGQNQTADPNLSYLDQQSLAANPYVYLIPTGLDTMRSPPLGDTSQLRQWKVDDVAIPLPFNIGGSGFSTKNYYQSADSLTEPLFTNRKHQAFRPTDSTKPFESSIYDATELLFTQFTNRRLVGRSVWNSQWKLVIPGDTLLADPKEGLSRFIQTVKDIKLYFTTYSYSGN